MKMHRNKKASKLPNVSPNVDLFQLLYSLQEALLVPSYKTNWVQTSPLSFKQKCIKEIVTAKML